MGRGNVTVTRSTEQARTGEYSLLVTGRTAAWNGITLEVTDQAEQLETFEFAMWVMPAGNAPVTFQLSVERVHNNGTTWQQFGGLLANVTAQPGVWTEIRGTRVFYEFDRISVYIETNGAGATADFYIDDVVFRPFVPPFVLVDVPPLHEVYADYFTFGTAVVRQDLLGIRHDFVRRHFNALTAGNDMKPDALQPSQGNFRWGNADFIAQTAVDNGMELIGHTLVWHSQSPPWMNPAGISREDAIRNLENHIAEVAGRYAGQVRVWDVVNEAFPSSVSGDVTNWQARLRQTPWLAAIGPDYIEIAFRAAHAADPNAILIYNDYNLDSVNKREAVYHMIKELLEKGVPIHGVGMQAHYSTTTSPQRVRDSIARFAELGIQVHITELDVTVAGSAGQERLTPAQERTQAILYARLFAIFKEFHEVIDRVTVWGLDDGTSWRSDRFPLLFNDDLTPKMSYYAVIDPEGFLREQGLS
jgi:endo-1,4-beta-xylanase